MNYILEINAFEQWLETHYLPISSQLLWYKLMNICNRSGWSEWVTVDNLRLMAVIKMSNEKTFMKTRDNLIESGLIEYEKGKKGSPSRYKLISFVSKKNIVENTVENTVGNTIENTVENTVRNTVENTVKSTAIYKHKQNINKNNINTVNSVLAQSCKNSSMQEASNNNSQIVTISDDMDNQNNNNDSEIVLTLLLNDKTLHKVTKKDVIHYTELYPATEVICELRKMKGWLESNPTKRKTKKGIKRFITSWLAREQDKGMYYHKNYNNYAKGEQNNEQRIGKKNENDIVQSTIEQGNVLPFTGFN